MLHAPRFQVPLIVRSMSRAIHTLQAVSSPASGQDKSKAALVKIFV